MSYVTLLISWLNAYAIMFISVYKILDISTKYRKSYGSE